MELVIPLFERFTALDVVGPYDVLSNLPGTEVTFVAEEPGPVVNDSGSLRLVAGSAFAEIDTCDVLLVPGGPGTRSLMASGRLSEWLVSVSEEATWVTSVCTGSLLLAAAGLLDGRRATTHWSAVELLASRGARFEDRRVVEDGRFLTAAGVSSGIDMALVLAARLAGDEVAKALQLALEYDPQPPFDAGSVHKADPATVELVRDVLGRS